MVLHAIDKQPEIILHPLRTLNNNALGSHVDKQIPERLGNLLVGMPLEILLGFQFSFEDLAGILGQYANLDELGEGIRLVAEEVFLGGVADLEIFDKHEFLGRCD